MILKNSPCSGAGDFYYLRKQVYYAKDHIRNYGKVKFYTEYEI